MSGELGVGAGLGILRMAGDIYTNHKNIEYQKWQNQQDKDYNTWLYGQQRKDNISDWNMMNAYNHPIEQMNRLRMAGLNPHLIYGKGAENVATMIRGANASAGGSRPAPRMSNPLEGITNIPSTINSLYMGKQVQAQTDNLHEQNNVLKQEALLKQALTAKTMKETAKTDFELRQAQDLYNYVIEQAKLNNLFTGTGIEKIYAEIEAIKMNTAVTYDRNEREQLKNSADVALTWQQLLTEKQKTAKTQEERQLIQAQIDNLNQVTKNAQLDEAVKAYHAKLANEGINPGDPMWARLMVVFINKLMEQFGLK